MPQFSSQSQNIVSDKAACLTCTKLGEARRSAINFGNDVEPTAAAAGASDSASAAAQAAFFPVPVGNTGTTSTGRGA